MPAPETLMLHSTERNNTGPIIEVGPEEAGWDYVGLRVIRIDEGTSWSHDTGDEEICLVPLSGEATVAAAGESWTIGRKEGLFGGKPTALYLPIQTSLTVTASSTMELAVTSSRATRSFPARLIDPDQIGVEIRVDRARNVRTLVIASALARVGEVEAAIDDQEVRITEPARQRLGWDQRFVHGGASFPGCR